VPEGVAARRGGGMPFGGEGYGEQGGGAVWRPQGAREEARIDAGCKKRRGLRMPAGRDGATGLAEPGALFGAPEGALDTGATPRGGGRRTLSWGAPRGRQEPGPVPVRVPGGAEPREGLGGQRDVAVLGALAAVDMALEARALARGALQAEGCLAAESQARDRGEGDLGMQGGADRRSCVPSSTRRTAGSRWAVCGRRSARVCQSRVRTCWEQKRMRLEQRRMDAGARPSTFLRCRTERCSACAERQAGDLP
jgi:hypothetical protein